MSTSNLLLAATNFSLAIHKPTCVIPNVISVNTAPFLNDLLHSSNLKAALPQDKTNGPNSVLGTLNAPHLLPYLGDQGSPPWGNATAFNANPELPPDTGVTRSYTFNVSRGVLSPDGVNRSMLLINGQFPGPMIEANWGDTISVTVNNAIKHAVEDGVPYDQEGTALHWHGFLQKETPWYDGVPSVQQCPIAPEESFTYTFRAELYGTSWYHSHYSSQYAGGAFGPMVVHGPSSADYDLDLGPVMLSDWNHDDYYKLVEMTIDPNQPPVVANNTLINGKMNYDCSLFSNKTIPAGSHHKCTPNAGLSKFKFTPNKKHKLRLINSGSEGQVRFSIDNHTLEVVAIDFVPVNPQKNSTVTLGIGQRMDVIVTANQGADAYWMRADIPSFGSVGGCSRNFQPVGLAAVYYDGVNTDSVPKSTRQTLTDPESCVEPRSLYWYTPAYKMTPPAKPATTEHIQINVTQNDTCSLVFTMNDAFFHANYNKPLLPLAAAGSFNQFPPNSSVYDFGTNSSIRIYLENITPISHPMHLHGHNFWVLAQGEGKWDGIVQANDTSNPTRRDVTILPKARLAQNGTLQAPGYLVIEYETNNPGVWPFHCHIAWHVSAGLYINAMERPKDIVGKGGELAKVLNETCKGWDDYTKTHVVDQIDSGLRIVRS